MFRWKFLTKKFAHHQRVSVERVVSGTGLANIYEFFAQEFPKKVNQKVQEEFMKAGDMKGKVVATNAKKCERAYYDITQLNEFKKNLFYSLTFLLYF